MVKICTVIDDDILIDAREVFEYKFGRWKRGSLKSLLELGLQLFIEQNAVPRKGTAKRRREI